MFSQHTCGPPFVGASWLAHIFSRACAVVVSLSRRTSRGRPARLSGTYRCLFLIKSLRCKTKLWPARALRLKQHCCAHRDRNSNRDKHYTATAPQPHRDSTATAPQRHRACRRHGRSVHMAAEAAEKGENSKAAKPDGALQRSSVGASSVGQCAFSSSVLLFHGLSGHRHCVPAPSYNEGI